MSFICHINYVDCKKRFECDIRNIENFEDNKASEILYMKFLKDDINIYHKHFFLILNFQNKNVIRITFTPHSPNDKILYEIFTRKNIKMIPLLIIVTTLIEELSLKQKTSLAAIYDCLQKAKILD